jgi:hypothetical protein
LPSISVIFKLVATPSGELALSLGKYKENINVGEFITVTTEFERNLKERLHELANLLGLPHSAGNPPTTVNGRPTNSTQ